MKTKSLPTGSVVRIATFVLGTLASPTLAGPAWAAPGCNAADLDGTYAFVVHGTNPAGQPFGAIGTLIADGAGNIDGQRIAVDNGVYATTDFTCTYSMSSDCLFRGPCTDDGEPAAEIQLDGALADGGRELMFVMSQLPAVAGGAVVTGFAREQ